MFIMKKSRHLPHDVHGNVCTAQWTSLTRLLVTTNYRFSALQFSASLVSLSAVACRSISYSLYHGIVYVRTAAFLDLE